MSRPRILMSNDQAFPSTETDTRQIMHTASTLGTMANLTLILPTSRKEENSAALRRLCHYYEVDPTFQVRLIPNPAFSLPNQGGGLFRSITRVLEKASHAGTIPRALSLAEYDWLHTRNLPSAWYVLRNTRLPVLYETYRPWPLQLPSAVLPLFRWLVRHPRFLGMVSHSAYNAHAWMTKAELEPHRCLVALNGVDSRQMLPRLSVRQARAQLLQRPEPALSTALKTGFQLGNTARVVGYLGHISPGKGLNMVLAMARTMPGISFLLVGATQESREIEREAEQLPNVAVLPWQRDNQMRRQYLYACNVLMIPPSSRALQSVGNTVLPIKVFEYLVAGRAVFAACTEDVQEILRHDVNAWLVTPDSLEEAVRELKHLLSAPRIMARLANQAARDGKAFSLDGRARRILDFACHRRFGPGLAGVSLT